MIEFSPRNGQVSNSEIHPSVRNCLFKRTGNELFKLNLRFRGQTRNDLRAEIGREDFKRSDGDRTSASRVQTHGFSAELLFRVEAVFHFHEQGGSLGCDFNSPPVPGHHLDSEFRFQNANRFRESRVRQMKKIRGFPKIPGFGEDPELVKTFGFHWYPIQYKKNLLVSIRFAYSFCMRYFGPSDIRKSLNLKRLGEGLRLAFIEHSLGAAVNSPRVVLSTGGRNAIGAMLSVIANRGLLGAKIVCVNPGNADQGRNPHQGLVALFDPDSGEARALFDASEITALRTVALSLVATDALANADASSVTVFGTGLQAYLHAVNLPGVRPVRRITVCGRNAEKAEKLGTRLRAELPATIEIGTTTDFRAATRSEILCLCTSATEPYLKGSDLLPGTHLNAIGACRPGMREIEASPVPGLRVFVDDEARAREEAAELTPFFSRGHARSVRPIGQLFADPRIGRAHAHERTLFKSVGVGLQDLVAAAMVFDEARAEISL